MIEKLVLEYFRTHKFSSFDFVEGVNCIIGLPDSGKSNVVRAINWVLYNRPLGKRMLSNFSDSPTLVEINFNDGNRVTLGKDKKNAIYELNGTALKAVGSDVPDEILGAINMSNLNIQRQLEKPYLICDTPGEVAKTFNRITRLEKPDEAVSKLTTAINLESKRCKQLKVDEENLKSEIESLGNVKDMVRDFKMIESIDKMVVKVTTKKSELELLLAKIKEDEKVKKELGSIVDKMNEDFDKLLEIDEKCQQAEEKYDNLEESLSDVFNAKGEMLEAKRNLTKEAEDYRNFLKTIKTCPFCDKCKSPISAHNLDEALKGIS